MQKIIPHLWFDQEAEAAARFYTSLFPDSAITHVTTLPDTPSGDTPIVSFHLQGYSFMAISAGPLFQFNPSLSFMVNFDPSKDPQASTRLDILWSQLIAGGQALMPLDKYPFSPRYGWLKDRYGLTWQLILTDPEGQDRPFLIPSFLFVGPVSGQAQAASDFYLSVFGNSKRGTLALYPAGREPDPAGTVMFTDFMLEGQWFSAMDSAQAHAFGFNQAVSLIVMCQDQAEIDRYWARLSADPQAEQCGWLQDKYGVSWQIVPRRLNALLSRAAPRQLERLTRALLPMKKLDLAALETAYHGRV